MQLTYGFSSLFIGNEDFLVGLVKRKQLTPSFCNDSGWNRILHPYCLLESSGGFKNTVVWDHWNKGLWVYSTGRLQKLYD